MICEICKEDKDTTTEYGRAGGKAFKINACLHCVMELLSKVKK